MLQDSEGIWVGDQVSLEVMVTNYYKELFKEEDGRDPACILGAFPNLSDQEFEMLDRVVTEGEIFNVVNYMGAFKAPWPDGLQAFFIQSQWKVVGESFCNMVLEIFRDHSKVRDVNQTLITLIPKVDRFVTLETSVPSACVMLPTRSSQRFLLSALGWLCVPWLIRVKVVLSLIVKVGIILLWHKKFFTLCVGGKGKKGGWLLRLIWRKLMIVLVGLSLKKH